MALTKAVKKAIWLTYFVFGLVQGVTPVFCDCQSAIKLSKNQVHHEKTKHINVKYNFIQQTKVIQVKKIGTTDNPTVMLKTPVPSHKFEHCLKLPGVGDSEG